jgi:hypothetical protein
MNTKVQNGNENFLAFAKKFSLMNLFIYEDKIVYTLPSYTLVDACVKMAQKCIDDNKFPLKVTKPKGHQVKTFVIEETEEQAVESALNAFDAYVTEFETYVNTL